MVSKGVSIIIPAYNEEKYLPLLLKGIKSQKTKFPIEIILAIDPRTSDSTRKIALSYGCKIVKGGRPAIARNNGAKKAKYNLFCFIDSDAIWADKVGIRRSVAEFPAIEYDQEFLAKAINEIETKNLSVAGTTQRPIRVGKFKDIIYTIIYSSANLAMKISEKWDPKMQVCMFIKRDLFKKLGGFRNIFAEDADLASRAFKYPANFAILRKTGHVYVSPRRFEANGIFNELLKIAKLFFAVFTKGYNQSNSTNTYFGD